MFTLPKLPYAYNALEPYIDARTMEIHYTKHHNAYTTNLNTALAPAGVEGKTIEEILTSLDMNNAALRNNAGGFYNHNLFWEVMSPNGGGKPTGELAKAIEEAFGSFEAFKEAGIFNTETAERFRNEILSKGGSDKEMTLYKNFRGKEPSLEPLLKRLIN